jgi:mannose-6-phosphate isomerase-like protein (cupin superfamily)
MVVDSSVWIGVFKGGPMSTAAEGMLIAPGAGRTIRVLAGRVTFKINSGESEGAYNLHEYVVEPGRSARAHRHKRHHENVCVLEGELVWRLGDRTLAAPAGSFLVIPRGVLHGFANEGPEPARMFVLTSPGGFEGFMTGLADLIEASPTGVPDPLRLAELAARYDTEFLSEEKA